MTTPTVIDCKTSAGGSGPWSVTFDNIPQDDDIILLFRGPDWNGELGSLPSGFAHFPVFGGGGWSAAGNGMEGKWKRAASEGSATYTVTTSGSPGGCYLTGVVIRGVNTSWSPTMDDMVGGGADPNADGLYNNNQTNAASIPSIGTRMNDALHLAIAMATVTLGTLSTPSGYTAVSNTASNRIAIYSRAITTPNLTGTLTPSGSFTGGGVGISLYFPPATPTTIVAKYGQSLGTTNTHPIPSAVTAGDLILVYTGIDSPSTTNLSADADYTLINSEVQGSNILKAAVWGRIATGDSSDNLWITGAAQDYGTIIEVIPAADHGVASVATDIPSAKTNAGSGNADPPNLSMGSTKDWKIRSVAIVDATTNNQITAMPSGYTPIGYVKSFNGATTVMVGVAGKDTTGSSSEDPGAYANNSQEHIAFTLAVPPASSAAEIEATFNASMGSLSASITATVTHDATFTASLGTLGASITGQVEHAATFAINLGGLGASVTATIEHSATLAASMGALGATISTIIEHEATFAADMGGLGGTWTADAGEVTATFAADLGGLGASVVAVVVHDATFTASMGGLSATVVGGVEHQATFTANLGGLGAGFAGELEHTATFTASMGGLVAAWFAGEQVVILAARAVWHRRPAAVEHQRPQPTTHRRPAPVEGRRHQ